MTLPFDTTKIDQTIGRYKEYLHAILNSPLFTFDELTQLDTKVRGIYFVFEDNELMYVGMTKNIKNRLLDMTSPNNRHSLNQILLDLEMGDVIFKATGYTYLNDDIKNRLITEEVLTKDDFKKYKNAVKDKIKKFKFKFYPTDLFNMRDLEHFAIAILNPVYNQ